MSRQGTETRETGMSLITVLMVIAVMGIMSAVISQQLTVAEKRKQSLVLRGEIDQVRAHLKRRINCEELPKLGACAIGGIGSGSNCNANRVRLVDHNKKTITDTSTQGTELSPGVRARACCINGNLRVEVKQTARNGATKKDPFNPSVEFNWTNIYEDEPSPCDYYLKDGKTILMPPGYQVIKRTPIPEGMLLSLAAQTSTRCPSYRGELGGTPEFYAEVGTAANCPAGTRNISGGAACHSMSILPFYPSFNHLHPSGFQKLSGPYSASGAWDSSCCMALQAIPLFWENKVATVCARDDS